MAREKAAERAAAASAPSSSAPKPEAKTAPSSAPKPAAPKTVSAAPKPVSSSSTTSKPVSPYSSSSSYTPSSSSSSSSSASVSSLRSAFEHPEELSAQQRRETDYYNPHSRDNAGEFSNADHLGGYHTVTLPLDSSASSALDDLASGRATTAVFSIDTDREIIVSEKVSSTPSSDVCRALDPVNPRFLLHAVSSPASASGRAFVYAYCCPDKSPVRVRMVYSTAKPNIPREAQKRGLRIAGTLEVRSGADLTGQVLQEAARPKGSAYRAAPAWQQEKKNASTDHAIAAPHPVYSHVPSTQQQRGGKSHVILPPEGAYC